MASFDPAAATAAYLAQLPPEAHTKATAYTQGGYWLLLWGTLVGIAAAWIILRTGVLTRISHRLQAGRPRPFAAGAVCALVFFLLNWVLTLPWAIYAAWWREKAYGLNNQTLGAWFGETALIGAIFALLWAVFFGLVYVLLRRAPRTWVLWAGGLTALFMAFVFLIAPVAIQPLVNRYTPAPPGEVREAVVEMAETNDVPSDKIFIYDGSRQSDRYTANVSGLFGTARIAMSDTMFKKGADLSEVRAVVGHEMGHYVHMHSIWIAVGFSLLAVVVFWLTGRLFEPTARLMRARGVDGIADPAGIPVLMTVLGVLALLATPITNSIIRVLEEDADRFSLERVNEPDGLSKALVKTIEYRAATPGKLEELIFYDHPAVGNRIRSAMEWKARHRPRPAPPADSGA